MTKLRSFHFFLQGDDIPGFGTRCDQVLLFASEAFEEKVVANLYNMRIRVFVQFQIVLAMYDDRDRAMPSHRRLQIMVRRHIDQMIRSRNFRARNERIETGKLKSEKCKEFQR